MTARTFSGLEFVHPDFGRRRGEPGNLPQADLGLRLSPSGELSTLDRHAAIRQALLMLLTTRPGERVMRPEYGCRLFSLLFSPNDDTTAGMAVHYVRQAIERWEPRVVIDTIDAERGAGAPGTLTVGVEYRVLATNRRDHLTVPVALSGQEL